MRALALCFIVLTGCSGTPTLNPEKVYLAPGDRIDVPMRGREKERYACYEPYIMQCTAWGMEFSCECRSKR